MLVGYAVNCSKKAPKHCSHKRYEFYYQNMLCMMPLYQHQ